MAFFFLRMGLVLLVLLVLPALYLYLRHMRKKPAMKRWSIALLVVTIALCGASVWYVSDGILSAQPTWACRLFFPVLLGVSLSEIFICLGSILAWATKKIPFLSRTFTCMGFTLAALNIIMVTMAFFIGNKRIEVAEYTYSSKNLPEAFDGFRVVHISDLHLGTYGTDTARVAQLIDKTLEQKGDAILFTGDLVNFQSKEALPFMDELKRLKAPYGVFSIMGNHDYAIYRNYNDKRAQLEDIRQLVDLQKECGWILLRNENALIEKNGSQIGIIGVENDGKPPFPKMANIPKASKGMPDSVAFKIMMTHDPSHWRRSVLKESDAQLTLAGHTHAMQFKIGDWSPASFIYKEWGGQYFEGARSLVVSIGLGLGSVPFRFGAWSEVVVITLKKEY